MTKLLRHTLLLSAAIVMLAACEERAISSDTLGTEGIEQGRIAYDTIKNMRDLDPGPKGDTIDVAEAVRLGLELPSGSTSSKYYYVLGCVKGISTPFDASYGNITPIITNKANSRQMLCYRLKGFKGADFTSAEQLLVGDVIVVYGQIQNRNGVPQITQGGYLIMSTNPEAGCIPAPVVQAEESFNEGIGAFAIVNKSGTADIWKHTPQDDDIMGFMIADANIGGAVVEAESWLVSPNMDLTRCTRGAQITFMHNFRGDASQRAQMLRIMISTDGGSNWKELPCSDWNDGTNGKWVNALIDLEDYKAQQVQIAFAYKSSATTALKWRIQNVRVGEPEGVDNPQ